MADVYASPYTEAVKYAIGTPERIGIINAYRATQRLLTITGVCLCVPLISFGIALRNPKLNNEQSLSKEVESEEETEETRDEAR